MNGEAHHFKFDIVFVEKVKAKFRSILIVIPRTAARIFNQIPVLAVFFQIAN